MFPQSISDFLAGPGSEIAKGFALMAGFWIIGVKVSAVWKAFTVACDISPNE